MMTRFNTLTLREFLSQFRSLILLNIILWALIPGFLLGNLHVDTLEALYWSRVPAFGYWKHPPLTTWLLGLAAQPGPYAILLTLLLSQALTLITAYFVGRLATGLAGLRAGQLAVSLFFVSSLASFYSIQVNHNSVLAPFMAATLALGIEYLETRKISSAIGLGLAVGLGALTKYEIIFAFLPLLIVALAIPHYRNAFRDLRSYLAVSIAVLIIAPHIMWLHDNAWISIKRAADSAPLNDARSLFEGFWGLLWGSVAIVATPLLMLRFYKIPRPDLRISKLNLHNENFLIGWIILILSPVGLILTGLITGQFVKALWLLPLVPAISIGASVVLEHNISRLFDNRSISLTLKGMVALACLFWFYLLAGEAIDRPHEAFFSQTKPLAQQVDALWRRYQMKDLSCVIINEGKIGSSVTLWLPTRPLIFYIPGGPWETKEKYNFCNEQGAIAIELIEVTKISETFSRACEIGAVDFQLESLINFSRPTWRGRLLYIPPNNEFCIR